MQNIQESDIQWLFVRLRAVMCCLECCSLTEFPFLDRIIGISDSLGGKITSESKECWRDFVESIFQLRQLVREAQKQTTCYRCVFVFRIVDNVLSAAAWYIMQEIAKLGGIEGSLLNGSCKNMCSRSATRFFRPAKRVLETY